MAKVKVQDSIKISRTGQLFDLVVRGRDDIGQRPDRLGRCAGQFQRPQLEPQFCVEGNQRARCARQFRPAFHRLAQCRAYRLREARYGQNLRAGDRILRHILRAVEAGCRASARIAELPTRGMRLQKTGARGMSGPGDHVGVRYPFPQAQIAPCRAEGVVADGKDITHPRLVPRGRNGRVGGIAAEALFIKHPIAAIGRAHELDQGLAEAKDLGGGSSRRLPHQVHVPGQSIQPVDGYIAEADQPR